MTKLIVAATRIGENVAHGFAQMASLGQRRASPTMPARSTSDAIRGDWVKLGGDMRRAAERVKREHKTR